MAADLADNTVPLLAEITDDELTEIGTILSMRRGIDISAYKDTCMKRRIAIRMRFTHCRDAAEYCILVRQSHQEPDLLLKTLTIHVSQFFRNPSMFHALRDEVLPGLFSSREKNGADKLRFWCLGCAGGEEPYSLAILLRENFSKEMRRLRTIIDGTDVDAETIRAAQQADYIEERLKEVPPGLRERYFRQNGMRFRLVPEIRQMVTFLQGDITRTAEYRSSDLVVCRNTLIYFNRQNQEKILHGIADILPAGGILVLGKSETLVGSVRQRFEAICLVERIFRKR